LALEGFDGIFLYSSGVSIALIVIEVNQVSSVIVLVSLLTFWTVSGEVPYFSTLEACVGGVCSGGCIPLIAVLGAISLVAVIVPLPSKVVASVVSLASVVPLSLSWRSVSIDIHRDRGVVHPVWGV